MSRDHSESEPESGGRGLMIVILIAGTFMCLGSMGGAGYFAWRAAQNVVDRERDARENQELARLEADRTMQQGRVEKVAALIAKATSAGGLPQQIYDERSRPLLSWRVTLLARSEEHAELFKQFRLNEAWDSQHNRTLLERRPEMFAPPDGDSAGAGQTYLRGFTMEGAAFGPPRTKARLRPGIEFSAGIEHTLVVFESSDPIEWTRPDDLEWRAGLKRPKLGGPASNPDSILTIAANGRIHEIKRSLPDETLRQLFEIRREKRPTVLLTPDMCR